MQVVKRAIQLLTPLSCVTCGSEGKLLCADCMSSRLSPKSPTCFGCNRLSDNFRTCPSCRSRSKLAGVLVAAHYEGAVKRLVQAIKYQNADSAAAILAGLLTPLLRVHPAGDCQIITSVPTSSLRRRLRGYNQAELIAKKIAKELKLPYSPLIGHLTDTAQVGKSRHDRLAQVQGIFYARSPRLLQGARVLLIDDVVTTGATMSECAAVLKAAGAKSVWGAAAAKH